MNQEAKEIAAQIVTHPKTAWLTVFIVNVSEWYIEWLSPIIMALTSVASFAVMIILVRYHWLNTKKLKLEIEIKTSEKNKILELERQLKGVSDRKKERNNGLSK